MISIKTTATFDRWLHGLRDRRARARVQVRIDRLELAHLGDCEPVGEGVSEMRIHYGPGYRVYFKRFGLELVVLLAGGDKSTQSADIALALKLARQLEG
jgi:putative addiction module killer protein